MYEAFNLISNATVIFADYFFEDWLSMAFYIGDTIHRILIARHYHTFNLFLEEQSLKSNLNKMDEHLY